MQVKFFQDIGIRDDAIGKMLVKFPPLLTYSLYKKIRPVVCSFLIQVLFLFPIIPLSLCGNLFVLTALEHTPYVHMHAHNNISFCIRKINQLISNSLARKLVLLVVVSWLK